MISIYICYNIVYIRIYRLAIYGLFINRIEFPLTGFYFYYLGFLNIYIGIFYLDFIVVTNSADSISAQQVNTVDLFVITLNMSVLTICITK